MTPTQWRRVHAAARTLDPGRLDAQAERIARAEAVLRAALTAGPLDLPDYHLEPCPDGRPLVAKRATTPADQLAFWRALDN